MAYISLSSEKTSLTINFESDQEVVSYLAQIHADFRDMGGTITTAPNDEGLNTVTWCPSSSSVHAVFDGDVPPGLTTAIRDLHLNGFSAERFVDILVEHAQNASGDGTEID